MRESNHQSFAQGQSLKNFLVIGLDEAGRGPLAGPVTAAAVILPPSMPQERLRDSKVLSEKQRELAYEQIRNNALAYAVVSVEPEEIDRVNILEATRSAMKRAVTVVVKEMKKKLGESRPYLLIDGNFRLPGAYLQESLVKGDQKIAAISAASIMAKVTRDRLMCEYDALFPGYGFALHKGYGTQLHREMIKELGPTVIHRRTFAGVREYLVATAD